MKKNKNSVFLCVFLLFAFTNVFGQSADKSVKPNNSSDSGNSLVAEDVRKKDLTISLSYDAAGRIDLISIEPKRNEETDTSSRFIKRENVTAIIDDLFPEAERGAKLSSPKSSFGRAYGESAIYEKGSINLTIVCDEENCGVSYAEIRFKRN